MPTPPPEPMADAKDEIEETARTGAVAFICAFLDGLHSYTYSHRSHLPAGHDATDFMQCLDKVKSFCKARPDWTLRTYLHSQKEYRSDYEAGMALKRLQGVVEKFEEQVGFKLDREYEGRNRELAEGLKAILAGRQAKARALVARTEAIAILRRMEFAVEGLKKALEDADNG